MSRRVRSLSTLYSPLLEGTPRPRRSRTWPVLLAVVALLAAGLLARRAAPSSGHRCADDSDCPSLVCSAGRCR